MSKKLEIFFVVLGALFLIFYIGIMFFIPIPAYATTYTYDCGDLSNADGAACTSGAWSKASAFSLLDAGGFGPLAAGTWYFSAIVSADTANPFRITCYEYSSGTCNTYATVSVGTIEALPFDVLSGTSNGIYLWGQTATNPAISELCITDIEGDCESGGGGEASTTPFYEIFGTTTGTYHIVDNPTQDTFNLILLFLIGFFGMSWLFAKKR